MLTSKSKDFFIKQKYNFLYLLRSFSHPQWPWLFQDNKWVFSLSHSEGTWWFGLHPFQWIFINQIVASFPPSNWPAHHSLKTVVFDLWPIWYLITEFWWGFVESITDCWCDANQHYKPGNKIHTYCNYHFSKESMLCLKISPVKIGLIYQIAVDFPWKSSSAWLCPRPLTAYSWASRVFCSWQSVRGEQGGVGAGAGLVIH